MPTNESKKQPPNKRGRKPTFNQREMNVFVAAAITRDLIQRETGKMPSDREVCFRMAPHGHVLSLVAADIEKLRDAQQRKRIAKAVACLRISGNVVFCAKVIELKTLQNVLSRANTLAKEDSSFKSMVDIMLRARGVDAPAFEQPIRPVWRPAPLHGLAN